MASHGTWKYRITGIFFCLALLIGIMILSVQTASADDYNVWVKGVRVTTDNASDVLGDGTVSYDAADKTLKLTNADLEVTSKSDVYFYDGTTYYACIFTDQDLTVSLSGNNVIDMSSATFLVPRIGASDAYADRTDGILSWRGGKVESGQGLLTIKSADATSKGYLTIKGGPALETSNCIAAYCAMTIEGCGMVLQPYGSSSLNYSTGLYNWNNKTISLINGADVKITAGEVHSGKHAGSSGTWANILSSGASHSFICDKTSALESSGYTRACDEDVIPDYTTSRVVANTEMSATGATPITSGSINMRDYKYIKIKPMKTLTVNDLSYTAPDPLTYDGKAKTPTVTYKNDITNAMAGDISLSYAKKTGSNKYAEATTAAPSAVGTYRVLVSTSGGTDYFAADDLIVGEFTVTESGHSGNDGSSDTAGRVKTGDNSNVAVWIVVLLAAAGATIAIVKRRKSDK